MSKYPICKWNLRYTIEKIRVHQTIAERRSKSAALRAALSKVGARARAALFKKDGSASASGALKKGRALRAPLIFLICALKHYSKNFEKNFTLRARKIIIFFLILKIIFRIFLYPQKNWSRIASYYSFSDALSWAIITRFLIFQRKILSCFWFFQWRFFSVDFRYT